MSYRGWVMTSSVRPVVLRNGVDVEDPLSVVLDFVEARWHLDASDPSASTSFGESDLRLANRSGARISAAQIAATLERRRAIERALRAIPPDASLAAAANAVPWLQLRKLFDAFADIPGVGLSKMTKALYRKRSPEVPGGRRPGSQCCVRRARARARPRLQTRSGPQPGGRAGAQAGARESRLRDHRGADPRSADLVRRDGFIV